MIDFLMCYGPVFWQVLLPGLIAVVAWQAICADKS